MFLRTSHTLLLLDYARMYERRYSICLHITYLRANERMNEGTTFEDIYGIFYTTVPCDINIVP